MTSIDVPSMSKKTFTDIERYAAKQLHESLERSMAEAGREECQLAIERDDYFHDIPSIKMEVGLRGATSIAIMPNLVWA